MTVGVVVVVELILERERERASGLLLLTADDQETNWYTQASAPFYFYTGAGLSAEDQRAAAGEAVQRTCASGLFSFLFSPLCVCVCVCIPTNYCSPEREVADSM